MSRLPTTSVVFSNIACEVSVPENGIISRTLKNDDTLKVVLFGFDVGQELSEHTASVPATIHILAGSASVTIGDAAYEAEAGFWAWMPSHMPHSILAKERTVMLLYMIKGTGSAS